MPVLTTLLWENQTAASLTVLAGEDWTVAGMTALAVEARTGLWRDSPGDSARSPVPPWLLLCFLFLTHAHTRVKLEAHPGGVTAAQGLGRSAA